MSNIDVEKQSPETDKPTIVDNSAQEPTPTRKVYEKPQLRKYAQIDYVTTYGVD